MVKEELLNYGFRLELRLNKDDLRVKPFTKRSNEKILRLSALRLPDV